MAEQKKGMDKMTKGFLIFMSVAFLILTVVAVFGNRSYELKSLAKGGNQQQQQGQGMTGGTSPEFQPYLEEMHKQISGKWQPPAVNKDSEVILRFTILKNGHVIDESVLQSSGDKEVDESALTALRKSSPLPPLPLSYTRDRATVNFNFTVRANQY
jgi:TonB family protein